MVSNCKAGVTTTVNLHYGSAEAIPKVVFDIPRAESRSVCNQKDAAIHFVL
jgi:hypothetical protein